jgi:AraC-like DNA-binding protein
MDCHIDVRFYPAPPDLADCFATFYRAEFTISDGGRVSDLLQPEWGNVRFFQDDCPDAASACGDHVSRARFTATGPSTMAARFELGTTRMWGIGFFPLGWAKFCVAPACDLANRIVDGEQHPAFAGFTGLAAGLFDHRGDDRRECERILACVRSLNREVPDEERIMRVHAALVDPAIGSVTDFVDHSGVGRRTLERLCPRYFGFAPKQLLRRQRFMRSLAQFMLEHGANWSGVLDAHYHDQSQFVRDFRAFMGMSPREYAAREHPILAAFMRERARIWGAAAQTLDRPPEPRRARPAPPA